MVLLFLIVEPIFSIPILPHFVLSQITFLSISNYLVACTSLTHDHMYIYCTYIQSPDTYKQMVVMYLLLYLIDPAFPIPHFAVYTFSMNNKDVVFVGEL